MCWNRSKKCQTTLNYCWKDERQLSAARSTVVEKKKKNMGSEKVVVLLYSSYWTLFALTTLENMICIYNNDNNIKEET